MPVTEITELHDGRRLEISDDFVIRAHRHLRVYCDSPFDGPVTVRNGGVPVEYVDVHPESAQLLCRQVEISAMADGFSPDLAVYDVMVTYSNQPITAAGLDGDSGTTAIEFTDPLERPPDVSYSTVDDGTVLIGYAPEGFTRWNSRGAIREPREIDEGFPIMNSAGSQLQVEKRKFKSKLTYKRNESFFDIDRSRFYIGTVNNATWLTHPERSALCISISGSRRVDPVSAGGQSLGQVAYWEVTYEFEIGSHDPDLQSFGVDHLVYTGDPSPPNPNTPPADTNNPTLTPISYNGVTVADPQPLDSWGRAIAPQYLNESGGQYYIDRRFWYVYPSTDFSQLNIVI